MDEQLLEQYRRGERRALARLISLAARGEALTELAHALPPAALPARVVAFTGSGGVGKSTLVGRLIGVARGEGPKVAVLACDPQSPRTGGALLGDRFRMGTTTDDGVYIRSLAALGGHGGVADHLDIVVRLLEGFGFGVVFLETVGAGQGDVAVAELADVVVLLLQPETGDDLQWEKAGILEMADLIVVHKSDMPGAEDTAAQVRNMLQLSPNRNVPVLLVSSAKNLGHQELWREIGALPLRHRPMDEGNLLRRAQDLLAQRYHDAVKRREPELARLLDDEQGATGSAGQRAAALLRMLAGADRD